MVWLQARPAIVIGVAVALLAIFLSGGKSPISIATFIWTLNSQLYPKSSSNTPQSMRKAIQPIVAVVGSGLAGSVASLAAAQADPLCKVVLFEKEPRTGGNSVKASSGINALTPAHGDSPDTFLRDTLVSGGGRSDKTLAQTLVADSSEALAYLQSLGVDLSGTVQLGGHTVKRTHFPLKGPNVGAAILKILGQKLIETPQIEIITGAKVVGLIVENGHVVGVKYTLANDTLNSIISQPAGAVVLASGGFGANKDLLAQYAPQYSALATTNGPFALGEGLAMAESVVAQLVDLDQVQVHPTGFLDPKDPDNKVKFLAPEKLRGVGGILLNAEGRRFINELATRDIVASAILKQQNPDARAFLLLGNDAAREFGLPSIDFYCFKGLMKKAEGIEDAATELGVSPEVLLQELEQYNAAVQRGTPDALGRTVFPSRISLSDPIYIATVVPVVHYTMGGALINPQGGVLRKDGSEIPGLFAAGEVAGGVHGANRLGGNSLLECCVFGLRAGKSSAAAAVAAAG